MVSSIRLRRLCLGALVAACAVLGAFSGTASATLRLTPTARNSYITIDADVHSFASSQRPITSGGYQYYAYWDQPDPIDGKTYLRLARRRLSDNLRVVLKFQGEVTYESILSGTPLMDGHNFVGLGLAPNDGTIHLSWSLHTTDRVHRYVYSEPGCMERSQEEFTIENCGFERREYQAARSAETSMTYPVYINDHQGQLYFTYRQGASSDGSQVMNAYDEARQTWTLVGSVIRGRRGGGEAHENDFEYETGDGIPRTSTERGVYALGWAFDKNERLHVAWVYRENGGGFASQHGINYAYTDNFVDWYADSGTRIGTAEEDPISIRDLRDTEVYSIPSGWYPGEGTFAVDAENNPHIVLWTSDRRTPDAGLHTSRQAHVWRTTSGTWSRTWIEGSEANSVHPSSSSLFFDRANNAYALFAHTEESDWGPYDADAYVQSELPGENVTWQEEESRDGLLDIQLFSATTCIEPLTPPMLTISTTGTNTLRMRMRNNTRATEPTLSWTVEGERGEYTVARQQRFRRLFRSEDGAYSEYVMTITDADWTGTLRALQLCTGEGVTTGSQSIDWIQLYNSTTRTVVKTWEFSRPTTMYAAEASPADNWSTWNIEPLLPGESLVRDQGFWSVDLERWAETQTFEFNTLTQGVPGNEALLLHVFYVAGGEIAADWRFDVDTMGWTAQRDVTSFRWRDDSGTKGLSGTLSGADSQLVSRTNLKIPIVTRTEGYVHVTMKNSTESRLGRIYFITDSDRTWNSTKSSTFATTARSGYTQYDIDMSRVSGWDGSTIYQMRLDPSDDSTRRETFNIDRIWISNNRTR